MKFLIMTLMGFTLSQSAFAHPESADVIAISKAVELGVHRIERLASLPDPANPGHKKLEPMFVTSLASMRAERTTEGGATFKIYGSILPDAQNQSSSVAMLSGGDGKVTSYTAVQTYLPANPVNWPETDALTLMEDALHFVLEGWVQNPDVKPYYLGLVTISLVPSTDAQGNMIALASVTSDDDARTLYIRLKTDGTFISYEIK